MVTPARHRRRSSAPLALVLAVAVGVVGAFGVIRAANARSADVERIEGLELALTPQDGPAQNFLLIGSDTRENADPNDPDFGGIGDVNAVSGRRSDTIMILRHEEDGNGASIVSLPRDLWVNIAGRNSPNRINSAYSDGTDVLTATITQELGIPIHHVVDIDFTGFKDLVDAAGGTQVCFLYPTRDKNTGLDQQPGCHMLDGLSRRCSTHAAGTTRSSATASGVRIRAPTSAASNGNRTSSNRSRTPRSTGSSPTRSSRPS
jgi:LCP family protein required for cell wall assembly